MYRHRQSQGAKAGEGAREGERRRKRETEQLDCHVNSCADR